MCYFLGENGAVIISFVCNIFPIVVIPFSILGFIGVIIVDTSSIIDSVVADATKDDIVAGLIWILILVISTIVAITAVSTALRIFWSTLWPKDPHACNLIGQLFVTDILASVISEQVTL